MFEPEEANEWENLINTDLIQPIDDALFQQVSISATHSHAHLPSPTRPIHPEFKSPFEILDEVRTESEVIRDVWLHAPAPGCDVKGGELVETEEEELEEGEIPPSQDDPVQEVSFQAWA